MDGKPRVLLHPRLFFFGSWPSCRGLSGAWMRLKEVITSGFGRQKCGVSRDTRAARSGDWSLGPKERFIYEL